MGRHVFCLLLGLTALCTCSKKEPEVQLPLGTWEKVTDFPGTYYTGSVAFVLNDMAFVGTGGCSAKDFYAYSPASDDVGYWGLGFDDSKGDVRDIWRFRLE